MWSEELVGLDATLERFRMHWHGSGYVSGSLEYIAETCGADAVELRGLYPNLRALLADARQRHLIRVRQILGAHFDEEALLDEVFVRARNCNMPAMLLADYAKKLDVDTESFTRVYRDESHLFVESVRCYEQRILNTMLREFDELMLRPSPREGILQIFRSIALRPTRASTGHRFALLTRVVQRGVVDQILYTDSAMEVSAMEAEDAVFRVLYGERDLFIERFADCIEAGKVQGEIAEQVNTDAAALQITLVMLQYMSHHLMPNPLSTEKLLTEVMGLIS